MVFQKGEQMNRKDIIRMAQETGVMAERVRDLVNFANLVASAERDRIYAEQLELPEPRLTGKFSIAAGKFKCTGCTGTWTDREDAKHHSCKDYQ
jgi:predicted membrane-bound mannosyltransferase